MSEQEGHSLRIVGDRLFVTSWDNLSIFRVADSSGKLTLLGRLNGGAIRAVVSDGSRVYASGDRIWLPAQGMLDFAPIERLAGERAPQLLGIVGQQAYLASGGQLLITDLANPAAPPLGRLTLPADPASPHWPASLRGIVVADGRLYFHLRYTTSSVPDAGELLIIDVHDPRKPRILSRIVKQGMTGVSEVLLAAGFMYVRQRLSNGVAVFDVRNPAAPVTDSQPIWQNMLLTTLASDGSRIYVGDIDTLTVIDVQDPMRPRVVASIRTPGIVWSLAVGGGRLYAGIGNTLTVIAISSPATPQIIARLPIPATPTSLAVVGDRVFVAMDDAGVRVIRIIERAKESPALSPC
jgi:hypothetical protein